MAQGNSDIVPAANGTEPSEAYELPPPLPFSLHEHRLAIIIFWTAIAAEVCFIPISFYYGLWFGTDLNHGACKLHGGHSYHPI
jgi:hypothetical protein